MEKKIIVTKSQLKRLVAKADKGKTLIDLRGAVAGIESTIKKVKEIEGLNEDHKYLLNKAIVALDSVWSEIGKLKE